MVETAKGKAAADVVDNVNPGPSDGKVLAHDRCLDEVRQLSCGGPGGASDKAGKSGHISHSGEKDGQGSGAKSPEVIDFSKGDVHSNAPNQEEPPPFKSVRNERAIPPHTFYDGRSFDYSMRDQSLSGILKDLAKDIFR